MPKLEIVNDENPMNPREWDNLGTFAGREHRRYMIGDKAHTIDWDALAEHPNTEDYLKTLDVAVWLPVYMYDHSGVSFSTSDKSYPFNDAWDASFCGIIYVTEEKIRKEFGDYTFDIREKVKDILRSEIKTYSAYVNREVFGYQIRADKTCDTCGHTEDELLDSCYGFYSEEDAKQAGEEALKNYQK